MSRSSPIVFLLAVWAVPSPLLAGCSAPVALADSADNYGAPLVVDLLANDRDADGDALKVTVLGSSCAGDILEVTGGLVRIEPAGHLPRACTIGYRITDATGRSATSQLSLIPVVLGPIFADGFEAGSTGAWSLVCISSCLPEPEFGK